MSRTQKVRINNVFSSDIDVTSGVPQGSVLGPLLLTIFVNNLPGAVAFGDCVMYADDLKIFSRNSIALHFDVKRVRKWCIGNSMQLNESKCKLPDYNSSSTDGALRAGFNISSPQKSLGVMMSCDLKWDLHVETRCRKATQCFFLLKRRLPQTASLLCKLNAYRAYLVPILTYASPVWYVNCGNCVRVEVIQKRAMRWIVAPAIGGECSLKDTYRHLKLLPLSLYLEVHDILFLLQIFYGKYDISFADFLSMKPEGRLRKYKIFDLPSLHYKRSEENFWYRTAKLVNIFNPFVDVLNQEGFMTAKKSLSCLYWEFFDKFYNSANSCTRKLCCGCSSCSDCPLINSMKP